MPLRRRYRALHGIACGGDMHAYALNDTGGTPTPDCHVERSRNISWKGNDVNCRKIVCLVDAPLAQADKQTLIQGVLIKGMCLFRVRLAARFPRSLCSLGMTRVGHPHPNGHQFEAYLYTVCAYSECEPQGGDEANAELDEKYK